MVKSLGISLMVRIDIAPFSFSSQSFSEPGAGLRGNLDVLLGYQEIHSHFLSRVLEEEGKKLRLMSFGACHMSLALCCP